MIFEATLLLDLSLMMGLYPIHIYTLHMCTRCMHICIMASLHDKAKNIPSHTLGLLSGTRADWMSLPQDLSEATWCCSMCAIALLCTLSCNPAVALPIGVAWHSAGV